jgi:hypothetical protein
MKTVGLANGGLDGLTLTANAGTAKIRTILRDKQNVCMFSEGYTSPTKTAI